MSVCPNCSTQLSCGCQKRTASNGTQCCDTCIASYEATLQATAPPAPNLPMNTNG
jgi:hypothetical protein